MQLYASGAYKAPTPDDVRVVVKLLGMTANQVAELVGAANGRTVRRWLAAPTTKTHATIDYPAWRLLLLEAGLVRPPKRPSQPRKNMR